MRLVFHSKGQIKDSSLDLYELLSLFSVNFRDVFFIKPKCIFVPLKIEVECMRDSYTHTHKMRKKDAGQINTKDSTKIFNLLKTEVKTKKGFKSNIKLTVIFLFK